MCWYAHRARVGQVRMTAEGYVMVRVPEGTPGAQGDRSWMPEHRFVVQQSFGRPLLPSETVHHINGDKADNRIVNLQVRQGGHGKGARFTCMDCGSDNIEASPLSESMGNTSGQ